jgi:3-hydroxy-9,10-secoandrosta-1,3,5(10)-triene-9,17-dione monooxygenase reductase component
MNDPAVTGERMRSVWSSFCSGVTVVTAVGAERPIGFTCQSFSSLSLDPPLVSFSAARTSTTWPKIRAQGIFCVNVLSHDHQDISAAFARSGTDKFAGVDWAPAPLGSPVLGGMLAWAECTLWAEYDGGDHTIVVGRVSSLEGLPGGRPLIFYRGRYGLS